MLVIGSAAYQLLGYTCHSLAGHLGVATATEETTHSLSEMAYATTHAVVHVSRKCLCCTREQMVKSRKRNEVLEHLKTNMFMLAYYTIDWRKFHVHRRRDLQNRGFAKFDKMWISLYIYNILASVRALLCRCN